MESLFDSNDSTDGLETISPNDGKHVQLLEQIRKARRESMVNNLVQMYEDKAPSSPSTSKFKTLQGIFSPNPMNLLAGTPISKSKSEIGPDRKAVRNSWHWKSARPQEQEKEKEKMEPNNRVSRNEYLTLFRNSKKLEANDNIEEMKRTVSTPVPWNQVPKEELPQERNATEPSKSIRSEQKLVDPKLKKQKEKFLVTIRKNAKKVLKNDFFSNDEVDWLFEMISTETNQTQKEFLISSLVSVAYPTERVKGVREKLLANGYLETMLKMAMEGTMTVHREISIKDVTFESERPLSKGAFAKIYKVKYEGILYALKDVDMDDFNFNIEEFRRELALFTLLQHENILPSFGGCTIDRACILTEFMIRGSLCDTLKEMKSYFDLSMAVKWAGDIASGCNYLHSMKIIHRDLKSLNILINNDLKLKIIDFGLSRIVDIEKAMTAKQGTMSWMAPEIISSVAYSEKADVYSFGIILSELITCEEPFHELKAFHIPGAIVSGKRPSVPENIDGVYKKLMEDCWDADPEKRPPFSEVCSRLTVLQRNLQHTVKTSLFDSSTLP